MSAMLAFKMLPNMLEVLFDEFDLWHDHSQAMLTKVAVSAVSNCFQIPSSCEAEPVGSWKSRFGKGAIFEEDGSMLVEMELVRTELVLMLEMGAQSLG